MCCPLRFGHQHNKLKFRVFYRAGERFLHISLSTEVQQTRPVISETSGTFGHLSLALNCYFGFQCNRSGTGTLGVRRKAVLNLSSVPAVCMVPVKQRGRVIF